MKATLKNPETTAAIATDPISRMRELASNIKAAKEEVKALNPKCSDLEHRIRSTVFNWLNKGVSYSVPLEKVVKLFKSAGGGNVVDWEYNELKTLWTKITTLGNSAERGEAELAEMVRKFGSARDQQLLRLHGEVVAAIEKGIRPFVDSDKDANARARGFPRPTLVHLRIGGWLRNPDVVVKARILCDELERPLPEITNK